MSSEHVKGSPNGASKCFEFGHRNNRGEPCGANVIKGTSGCRRHAGKRPEKAKAEGAVVTELRRWGLTSQVDLVDPGQTLLKLVTQSAGRADFLADLLEQAFDAAERLAEAERVPDGGDLLSAESARLDLERVLNTGGVAALIGNTYAADKQAGIFATGEAVRGLQALENAERDRCAGFAATAIKAGLAERMVRLAEQQGAMLAAILVGALEDLGVVVGEERVRQVLGARIAAATGAPLVLEGQGGVIMADCAGSSRQDRPGGGFERRQEALEGRGASPADPQAVSGDLSGPGWETDEQLEAGLRRVLAAIAGLPPKVEAPPADRDDFDCTPYPEGDGRHDYRKTASSYDETGLDHPDYRDGETCWRCRRCGDVFVALDAEMAAGEERWWDGD